MGARLEFETIKGNAKGSLFYAQSHSRFGCGGSGSGGVGLGAAGAGAGIASDDRREKFQPGGSKNHTGGPVPLRPSRGAGGPGGLSSDPVPPFPPQSTRPCPTPEGGP